MQQKDSKFIDNQESLRTKFLSNIIKNYLVGWLTGKAVSLPILSRIKLTTKIRS